MVCLYLAERMTYFRYLCTLKELTAVAINEWTINEHLDARQFLCIVQEITTNVMRIVNTTEGNFKILFTRLKHFFSPSHSRQ